MSAEADHRVPHAAAARDLSRTVSVTHHASQLAALSPFSPEASP